jgi:hypothetical protein
VIARRVGRERGRRRRRGRRGRRAEREEEEGGVVEDGGYA